MPEIAIVNGALAVWKEAGAIGLVLFLGVVAFSAFAGGKVKVVSAGERKPEDSKGSIKETQQVCVSGFSEMVRRFDSVDEDFDEIRQALRRMETIGEVLKDRGVR